MTYLIPLTPERASTTFAGVPCTDATHFDINNTVRPGDWDSPASCPLKHGIGHRRCKVPRKLLVIKESTGEFAITHGKTIDKVEHRFMEPTAEIVKFFRKVGVLLGPTAETARTNGGRKANGLAVEKELDGDWEMVSPEEDSEYVMV